MIAPRPWTWAPRDAYVRDANGDEVVEVVTDDADAVRLMLRAVNSHGARIDAACEMYGALTQLIEVAGGYAATSCFSPEPVLLVAALDRAKAALVQAESIGRDCA